MHFRTSVASMSADRNERALARIEAALARIEGTPPRSSTHVPGNDEALAALEARHNRLKAQVASTLGELDGLIAGIGE